MIDAASLLELAEFTCCRCGKPGPDTFADLAGLEAAMTHRALPPNGGAVRMEPFGVARVDPADLVRFGPCHRRCPQARPPSAGPPYDLLKSVA